MKTIAVDSGKVGAGKGTLAIHLAPMAATRSGRRTLLWDLDAQGASTFALRLKPKPGLSARHLCARVRDRQPRARHRGRQPRRGARGRVAPPARCELAEQGKNNCLKKLLRGLNNRYDRVVLDCPPSRGDLAEQLFCAADLLVMPLLPSPLSLRVYGMVIEEVAGKHGGKLPILPVFSMVDQRGGLHRLDGGCTSRLAVRALSKRHRAHRGTRAAGQRDHRPARLRGRTAMLGAGRDGAPRLI